MKKFIEIFDRTFSELEKSSRQMIKRSAENKLFFKPKQSCEIFSVGEIILRSAGTVEQTFGGITANLWDDPFEWTLPEELSTKDKIFEYLNEVEKTRENGFAYFQTDEDLQKEIKTPWGMKTLFEILLETLTKAENLQGRAFAIYQLIQDDK